MATQTRISETAHERLSKLAQRTGKTHQEVIDTALRAYERDLFLDSVNASFAALQDDASAWTEELSERAAWDATLADGED